MIAVRSLLQSPAAVRIRRVAGWRWLGFLLAFAVLAIGFSTSRHWLYHGNDLRNRIVGARALEAGIDPYDIATYNEGAIPRKELLDPYSWQLGFSAVTATPTTLIFYRLYSNGDWSAVRKFWSGFEWSALLLSCIAFGLAVPDRRLGGWIAFGLAVVMVRAPQWRFHANLGQYYIFPAALVCIDCALLWSGRANRAGWFIGLAAAFRPTVVVLAPVLWLLGHRRAAIACAVTALAILSASFAAHQPLWASFETLTGKWVHRSAQENRSPDLPSLERAEQASELARLDGFQFVIEATRRAYLNRDNWSAREIKWRSVIYAKNWKMVSMSVSTVICLMLIAISWYGRRYLREDAMIVVPALGFVLLDLASPIANAYNPVMLLPLTGVLVLILSTTIVGSWRFYGSGAVLGSYITLTHLKVPVSISDTMAFDTMVAALASAAILTIVSWRRQPSLPPDPVTAD